MSKGDWELDSFLKSRGLSHVTLLHVDIQGCEAELFGGGHDTLNKGLVDYLFVSTHSQELHQRIMGDLAKFGYRIEVSSDFENDTTSYDGFVFASSQHAKQIFSEFSYAGRTKITASSSDDLIRNIVTIHESTSMPRSNNEAVYKI